MWKIIVQVWIEEQQVGQDFTKLEGPLKMIKAIFENLYMVEMFEGNDDA
jgi:hypothetical protein